jgi:hypothetical protein
LRETIQPDLDISIWKILKEGYVSETMLAQSSVTNS